MNLSGFLTAAVFVVIGSAAPQQLVEPTADFAFRYEFKPCQTHTLDTYANKYTRLGGNDPSFSIPFTLSPLQTAAVYQEIANIRFFDYPTDFKGVLLGAGETTTTSPSTAYRLEVRSAGIIHTVAYDDRYGPRSQEANRLLNLFDLVNGFIKDNPDVKRLPAPRVNCM